MVAVLALLAALVASAVPAGLRSARDARCRANLAQLQVAWITYTGDHQDRLPPNRFDPVPGTPYGRASAGSWVTGHSRLDLGDQPLRDGVLFPYVNDTGVYRCPSDHSHVDGIPDRPASRSYALSGYLNGTRFPPLDARYRFRLSHVENPAERYSFIDHHAQHGNGFFLTWPAGVTGDLPGSPDHWFPNGLNHLPGPRHGSAFQLAFVDGHVDRQAVGNPETFVPSGAGNGDLAFLRLRIPDPAR